MNHWIGKFPLIFVLLLGQAAIARSGGYEQGIAQIRTAIAGKRYAQAERLIDQLRRSAPRDQELATMAARVKLWQGRHDAAIHLFREALAIRPNPLLRGELERAEGLQALAQIDRRLAAGIDDEAVARLSALYQIGVLPYETGRRLAPLLIRQGDMAQARSLYAALTGEFPKDRDFVIQYAGLLMRLGEKDRARNLLDQGQWRGDAELAELREKLDSMREPTISAPDTAYGTKPAWPGDLPQDGSTAEAERQLRILIDSGRNGYEAGLHLGYLYRKRGDHAAARDLYAKLRLSYPADRDFAYLQIAAMMAMGDDRGAERELDAFPGPYDEETIAMRGRLAVRQKNYDEAVSWFNTSLAIREDAGVRDELSRLEVAMKLAEAERAAAGKETARAEEVWHELFNSGRETYRSGYLLGMAAIARRDYSLARDLFTDLATRHPADSGFRQLRIESLILAGEFDAAQREIAGLPAAEAKKLTIEREDLLYRVRRNSLKLSAGWYTYSGNHDDEQDYQFTLSQQVRPLTVVLNGAHMRRYGLSDNQFGVDLYTGKGEKSSSYGYVGVSVSPEARFLPRTTFSGELFRTASWLEYSAGYVRMNFPGKGVNIGIIGASLPLPATFTLNERLYLVADSGAFTFLSTLYYEPDHHFRANYAIGAGTAMDKPQGRQDTERLFTLTNRLAFEYRPTPAYSCGTEISHEHRNGQYDKAGATLFCRYWW